MSEVLRFSLNRTSAPRLSFAEYAALCARLGIDAIEIRNDLPHVEIGDGTPAEQIRAETEAVGLTILSINALQRFDQFDAEREREAEALARYAQTCGAKALVLCPTSSVHDGRGESERRADLVYALIRAPVDPRRP
jgi:2-keto-myo-inositol isomerase